MALAASFEVVVYHDEQSNFILSLELRMTSLLAR